MKDEVLQETRRKMDKVLEAMARDLSRVRTGRASVALLEGIKVECYGTTMPLDQVASLAAPESRLLTVQPWDSTVLGDIEKAILKGTRVAGIYDRDPEKDDRARMLTRLTYFEVLEKSLRVMDSTAITMAMEQHIPIIVFKLLEPGNMKKVVLGETVGTIVEKRGDER